MYYCEHCENVFDEPERKEITFEDFYGVDHLFSSSHRMTLSVCPGCGSEDIEEMQKCEICEEYFREDELFDTDEYINGGCGYCCQQCIDDGDMIPA